MLVPKQRQRRRTRTEASEEKGTPRRQLGLTQHASSNIPRLWTRGLKATLHSEGVSKAVSLFCPPALDNSKEYALNVDQGKQTRHRSYVWAQGHDSCPIPLAFTEMASADTLQVAWERNSETKPTS